MYVMDNNLIQQDICDFYIKLMKAQSKIEANSLAAWWNLWPIIASYTLAVYWKQLNVNVDWLLQIIKNNQPDTD